MKLAILGLIIILILINIYIYFLGIKEGFDNPLIPSIQSDGAGTRLPADHAPPVKSNLVGVDSTKNAMVRQSDAAGQGTISSDKDYINTFGDSLPLLKASSEGAAKKWCKGEIKCVGYFRKKGKLKYNFLEKAGDKIDNSHGDVWIIEEKEKSREKIYKKKGEIEAGRL